jgi:DNA primase
MGLLEAIISKDQELEGSGRWLHGVVNDSLVVDVEKQIFFWNSRDIAGDVYVWLTQIKGMEYAEAKAYLREQGQYYGDFIHTIKEKEEVVVYPKLVDVFYEEGMFFPRDYWEKRGISTETINRYKLGYHQGWYMIPLFQDGLFRNFQMRQEIPEKKIRSYYNGVGRILFNSDIMKITDKIIIAEGPTDCLRLVQEGVPCVSHNAGSEGWDDKWFKYFIHQKEIIVCYDNDSAGEAGVKKVAKNLGIYRTKVYTFPGMSKGYDIIDFFRDGGTAKQLLDMFKDSKYIFEV